MTVAAEQYRPSLLAFTRGLSERKQKELKNALGLSAVSGGFMTVALYTTFLMDFLFTWGVGSVTAFWAAHLATSK